MKKVRLALDALQVETFTTSREVAGRGTVHGEQVISLDAPERTCYNSCLDPASCDGTCNCTVVGPQCP